MEPSPEELYKEHLRHPMVLIGAGGIISVALPVLVRTGTRLLTIYDDDTVEPVNLQAQNFDARDIGFYKAEVLAGKARLINPHISATAYRRRLNPTDLLDGIVASGVDSMKSRSMILESVLAQKARIPLYFDGRLSRANPDWAEFYAIDPQNDWEVEAYRSWIFDDDEVPRAPRPETLATHAPQALATLMGAVLARWVRDGSHPWKVTFDAAAFHAQPYYSPQQEEQP